MEDSINSPSHYTSEAVEVSYRLEPIDLCEQCGFLVGNALKYLFRYRHKGTPLEDLKKARYYLRRRIDFSKWTDINVDIKGWDITSTAFQAFSHKEFFKYCCETDKGTECIEHLLQWVNEEIEHMEQSGEG